MPGTQGRASQKPLVRCLQTARSRHARRVDVVMVMPERGDAPETTPKAAVRRQDTRILDAAERSKGAAGFRCRQLDGRAAILMVVARPRGCAVWQARFADRPHVGPSRASLEAQSQLPSSAGQPEHVSRDRANLVAPAARPRSILSAMGIAQHLATPLITQLTDGLSELAAFRRRDAIEDCVFCSSPGCPASSGCTASEISCTSLLVGLMLLLLGALNARDAAAARGSDVGSGQS